MTGSVEMALLVTMNYGVFAWVHHKVEEAQ